MKLKRLSNINTTAFDVEVLKIQIYRRKANHRHRRAFKHRAIEIPKMDRFKICCSTTGNKNTNIFKTDKANYFLRCVNNMSDRQITEQDFLFNAPKI